MQGDVKCDDIVNSTQCINSVFTLIEEKSILIELEEPVCEDVMKGCDCVWNEDSGCAKVSEEEDLNPESKEKDNNPKSQFSNTSLLIIISLRKRFFLYILTFSFIGGCISLISCVNSYINNCVIITKKKKKNGIK
jgi:hypothetical protein